MAIRAVAFDFGHTLIDEQKDGTISLESRKVEQPMLSDPKVGQPPACILRLRQDDDFSDHSQLIVQHALILVNAWLGEGRAEAGRAQRGLCQANAILR